MTPVTANRLAKEPSPYLRQHATNPVDWYPWGPEALERAKREHKPILLSVGYSACHWCHVMAHESFEDPATAALMNEHFVNVKLDREERPDLDQLYQGVVQLMGRGGGWPLTVFLTPDLRPFYGGTYFPPAPRHGLPAFSTLVGALGKAWKVEPEEIEQQAQAFKAGLTELAASGLDAAEAKSLAPGDVVAAAKKLSQHVDHAWGGFGVRGPKFPNPMNVALLLRGWRRTGEKPLLDDALLTLARMAEGGVYDQLGGGFHRYSVDERWLVPHFEKMLYDNAQLLHLYSEAMLVAPEPRWRRVVEETVRYVERELTSKEGGFFAAQDADTDGEEGLTFVWTSGELDALLGADAELLKAHLGVSPGGNFETGEGQQHGATVLHLAADAATLARARSLGVEDVERRLAQGRATLLAARQQRPQPGLDDKILTGWNGLMIRGLAYASRVFQRPQWAALAARAADFVLEKLRRADGRLHRAWHRGEARLDGMAEDYGDLCAGLVALYQATFDARYLEAAEQLADQAVALFWDGERKAYLAAPKGQGDLLVPTWALHDNAFPSGASSLTEAHVALAALTGHQRHYDQAGRYLERLRDELAGNPMAFGHLLLAADAWLDGAAEVSLIGSPTATAPFLQLLDSRWLPTLAVHRYDPATPLPRVSEEVLSSRTPRGECTAWMCRSSACQAPVTTTEALAELIQPLGVSAG